MTIETLDLKSLPLIRKGKVRDIYEVNESTLLLVATDRISAFDFLLDNTVRDKGKILTLLTHHWIFNILPTYFPDLKHHIMSLGLPTGSSPTNEATCLIGRTMAVRKYTMFPFECIVRGYITGSAWAEYKQSGTVHGIKQPAALQHGQPFPSGPIYTPAIKVPYGGRDENIHPAKAREMVGDQWADQMENLALGLYRAAHDWALQRGIIIADTKFEFGHDEDTGEVILADEILTPDCSRFWPVQGYAVGQVPKSFDKQYLCDWLTENGLGAKAGIKVPDEIIAQTRSNYHEIFQRLTGQTLETALASL
ncbi:uncharacterized protein BDW47DRAFT_133255 [Aspergillus candidus]|uniref:Phosphoribosylaminoimidazole-succinocarboxamide synthase n=1 Tax=Aspergillus candidus TaxID=41067 RepID=A0A2I2F5K1_ASPCN|nr:hypothetical protein BDW47DRAFT_133255 [Aspergillus candidus]PLB35901.1 hypothetical protein BDW47DRAFT_133255 [Aspergillus candidus]